MPHPNSLMYNVYLVPFLPMKVFWFLRKSAQLILIQDFPAIPENHPDNKIHRGYFGGLFSFGHWVTTMSLWHQRDDLDTLMSLLNLYLKALLDYHPSFTLCPNNNNCGGYHILQLIVFFKIKFASIANQLKCEPSFSGSFQTSIVFS